PGRGCVGGGVGGLLRRGQAAPVLAETVLEKIGRTGVVTAGTRGSSIPLAFINEKNEWIGFSIDLLEAIRARLEKKLGKPIRLEKKEVGGDPATRIPPGGSRTIDLEGSATTHPPGRDETAGVSIPFSVPGSRARGH